MDFQKRVNKYVEKIEKKSITIIFSGKQMAKSADQSFPFVVNRNFYYLTGIEQKDSILVIINGTSSSESFLFIDEFDSIKALWDGKTLSYEDASLISGIKLENIKSNKLFKSFINDILSSNRRAIFGELTSVYLDLERQNESSDKTVALSFAAYLQSNYPHLKINSNQMALAELRMIKDQDEIDKINYAISITNKALLHVLRKLKPNKYEFEIEAEYNYILNMNRCVPSFDTIAASGKNATILHYVNNDSRLNDNDLLLLDLGVSYGNYCSDISRTYPVNGKFTKRQKEIYEIVLEANKKTIKWLKAGVTVKEFNDYGKNILIDGLKRIGLITKDEEITKYYYHGLGHYLGLDVHDVGNYNLVIQEGSVITVEPGLYISEEGIGIRIEDDCLVLKDRAINLSKDIVKEISEIESLMEK